MVEIMNRIKSAFKSITSSDETEKIEDNSMPFSVTGTEKVAKKVEKNEYEGFANGFPSWNLEPPGVAERFLKRLVEAVNFRLNKATDNFQKSRQTDENEIIQSLMQLRRELQFILKAVDINAIPVKEKMELRNMIINQSNSIQESLEKSAESDRTGKLSSIIKNNKVTIQ